MERMNFWVNNHSNCSNRQVLLSFIFFCYNVSCSYYQLLPMEHYIAGNLQSAWNEWSRLRHSFPLWVRKCQNKRLNSLDKMASSGIVVINAAYNVHGEFSVDQGHGSQLVTIYLIAVQDVHPESLHSISYRRDGVDIVTTWSISLFPVSGQVLLTRAKLLLFERKGKWFLTHSN